MAMNSLKSDPLLLLALGAALACAWNANATRAEPPERRILGTDDRQEFRESGAPWQAIGRLHGQKNRFRKVNCSGALVSPRVVLSAGHCLSDDLESGSLPETLELDFTRADGRSSKAVAFHNGGIPRGPSDWSLIVLAEPLGLDENGEAIHFEMLAVSDPGTLAGKAVRVIGYSPAFMEGARPAEARGQIGQARADGVFAHDADTTSGISGGPILEGRRLKPGERPRILGVHTASDPDEDPDPRSGLRSEPRRNYGVALQAASEALAEVNAR
jgi:V8-like Glu-specific endopeptidase